MRFGAGPITTAPTVTGPAQAPRPTSSMPHTSRSPASKQPCSTRSLGAPGRRTFRTAPLRRSETLTADAMERHGTRRSARDGGEAEHARLVRVDRGLDPLVGAGVAVGLHPGEVGHGGPRVVEGEGVRVAVDEDDGLAEFDRP